MIGRTDGRVVAMRTWVIAAVLVSWFFTAIGIEANTNLSLSNFSVSILLFLPLYALIILAGMAGVLMAVGLAVVLIVTPVELAINLWRRSTKPDESLHFDPYSDEPFS